MIDYAVVGLLALVAYLLGSIPTAVWYGKSFYNIDIREHGSGNAGATNTFRVLGKKPGSVVMAVDVLKGYIATSLARILFVNQLTTIQHEHFVYYQLAFGILAVVGHIFPVFARFKGGKGIATLLGMIIALHSVAAFACLAVFLVVLLISKYVSLGSMIAAVAFPIFMALPALNRGEVNYTLVLIGAGLSILVIYTHRNNISRLMKGEENKTYLIKSKN